MRYLEELSIGGLDEMTTVTNLCTYAFAGNSALKKLTIHADPAMSVGTRIFAAKDHNTSNGVEVVDGITYCKGTRTAEGSVPNVIHFTGQAISAAAIDNLLDAASVVDTAAKPVVICASRFQSGWGGDGVKANWISPATPEERAAYPGEHVIGIYRAGAEAPSGKAVIVHRPNAYDLIPGMKIIFR
jgi:hypothetical protein